MPPRPASKGKKGKKGKAEAEEEARKARAAEARAAAAEARRTASDPTEAEAELAENRRLPEGSFNGFAPSAEAEAPTRGRGQRSPSSRLGRARCPTGRGKLYSTL